MHIYSKDNRKEIKNFETSIKHKKKVDKPDLPKSKRMGNHKKRKNSFWSIIRYYYHNYHITNIEKHMRQYLYIQNPLWYNYM